MKNKAFNIDSAAHPLCTSRSLPPSPLPGVPLQVTPIVYSVETASLLNYLSMFLDLKQTIIYSSRNPKPGDL